MLSLRLIAWNCNHGSLSTRLSELAEYSPDIVFLQECAPAETLPLVGQFFTRRISSLKAIALGSLNAAYHLAELEPRVTGGRAALGAAVAGPVSFTALGIWAQGPNYVDDVVRTLDAYDEVLRSGPSVVMGDLNSGTNLKGAQPPGKGHKGILTRLADLGLVSAYHSFHQVEHGRETHPTYRHQRDMSQPWHIDFCFVPASWFVSRVEVLNGEKWTLRSDHFPLKVDIQFGRSVESADVESALEHDDTSPSPDAVNHEVHNKAVLHVVQTIEQLQEVLADESLIDTASPAVLADLKNALDNLDVVIAKLKRVTS